MPINVTSEVSHSIYTADEVDQKLSALSGGSTATWDSVKPSNGVQRADLATDVQASLDKADTALQSPGVVVLETRADYDTLDPKDPTVVYVWKA